MSETVIIAIISLVGGVVGAAIGAIAKIESAKITKKDENTQPPGPSRGTLVLVGTMAGVVGLAVGALLAYVIIPRTPEDMISGTTLMISSVPGKIDNAVEISFSLEEDKWVGINKTLDAGLLVGTGSMRFYCKGSGAPNTLELKLIHVPDENEKECVCRMLWNQVTNTGDDWISLEAPYTDFECWESTCPPGESPQLDVSRVHRIDFAISNKADQGDTSGTGIVSLDHVQAFTTNQGASVTPVIVDTMDSTSGWETYSR